MHRMEMDGQHYIGQFFTVIQLTLFFCCYEVIFSIRFVFFFSCHLIDDLGALKLTDKESKRFRDHFNIQ